MRATLFVIGILILILSEFLKVYFIMPFPGSQESHTIDIAYFLHTNINYFRLIGIFLITFPLFYFWRNGRKGQRIAIALSLALYVVVFYFFSFRMVADKIFYQPENKIFAAGADNKISSRNLVLGVTIKGQSKAYPIELIGYHHQVRDTVGDVPVMITYCTVCRTGRVFSPAVEGKVEDFRLVGMDHFNAMFEDKTTKSWWQQATGVAITGPSKGKALEEIPSEQMSLGEWLSLHPESFVLQPDSTFAENYEHMKTYDEGKGASDLTRRDSLSWQNKSWVVGVQIGTHARAYDWNDLVAQRVINDTLSGMPIAILLAGDSTSFHVLQRDSLSFSVDSVSANFVDQQTHSHWKSTGECIDGSLSGKRLPTLQSYQEFWHSWRTFRPQTTRYVISN